MKSKTPVYIGIDWADIEHVIEIDDPETNKRTQQTLKQKPENIIQWGIELETRYLGRPIYVCLEQGRGPLIAALSCIGGITCYPVNPKSLSCYRNARFPSRRKNDPIDAKLLCDYLGHHHEELRPYKPMDDISRKILFTTENRRKMVDERSRQLNRLRAALKMYFPQIIDWFSSINTRTVWDLLIKWPSLDHLKTAQKATLLKFLYAHHVRNSSLLKTLPDEVKKAINLHQDDAILETSTMLVESICHVLLSLQNAIDRYDKKIEELMTEHPDFHLFAGVPGAGAQLLPRMLSVFGADRERFQNAAAIQELAGIAPVVEQSGKSQWTHFRWAASSFMRQTFHEHALHSMAKSTWAKAYYQTAIARGKSHHVAIRALAYKWIRILYACWKNNTPYDESKYLKALKKTGSPYAK